VPSLRIFTALCLLGMSLWTLPAMADCKTGYDEAASLVKQALGDADQGKKLDSAHFEQQYTAAINQLVNAKCQTQLMQLYQLAEDEKLKRTGSPSSNTEP
jgi:hypothetical protein